MWRLSVRGDIHHLPSPRGATGHEQTGNRYAVILQSDDLELSTVIVAPTSTSARPASFRPTVTIRGKRTTVLVEQLAAADRSRLGHLVGRLHPDEMHDVNDCVRRVLVVDLPW